MIYLILYILMCTLWTIFCIRVNFIIHGRKKAIKYLGWSLLNFPFAPISLIMAIRRIPKDFKSYKEEKDKKEIRIENRF